MSLTSIFRFSWIDLALPKLSQHEAMKSGGASRRTFPTYNYKYTTYSREIRLKFMGPWVEKGCNSNWGQGASGVPHVIEAMTEDGGSNRQKVFCTST